VGDVPARLLEQVLGRVVDAGHLDGEDWRKAGEPLARAGCVLPHRRVGRADLGRAPTNGRTSSTQAIDRTRGRRLGQNEWMQHGDLPAIVATNVERWRAEDDAWRGYHRRGEDVVLDARVEGALRLLLPRPGGALLDIGCANGVLTRQCARASQAARVCGVDFVDHGLDPREIAFTRANLDASAPLPFDSASFDVVTCMETLEHLHDTDHIVSEIGRLLRPDGYAVVAVPRLDAVLSIAMLTLGFQPPAVECSLRRRYGSPGSSPRVSGHVSHFTRRALYELVAANGLTVDAFAQASIYSAWRHSMERPPPLWQRLPMWALSKIPVKQDELLVRIQKKRP
jgi:2-polyprenyl-3-methyl-5-hydroxy-6-metoxy-1,4-benzoquinol methylase